MDKNYKIVEIPEVKFHHPLLVQVVTECSSRNYFFVIQFNNAAIDTYINFLYRRVVVWWQRVHSTLWRSFFGIVQQSLLLIMTPLHCALSALETLEAASAKAVERLSVSKTAPMLGDNMRWSVSCLAGDQQATSKFYKKLMFRIGEDGRQKVVGVLRLLLLRDQGSNIWQQIGERMHLHRNKNLLNRPAYGPRGRTTEKSRGMGDVPDGGGRRDPLCPTRCR